jgi:hypothetical protein
MNEKGIINYGYDYGEQGTAYIFRVAELVQVNAVVTGWPPISQARS